MEKQSTHQYSPSTKFVVLFGQDKTAGEGASQYHARCFDNGNEAVTSLETASKNIPADQQNGIALDVQNGGTVAIGSFKEIITALRAKHQNQN